MIELKLVLDDVDYDKLADMLLPVLFEQMSQAPDAPLWSRVLLRSQGLTESTAKAVLARMSQAQKDAMLVRYIQRNGPALCRRLEEIASRSSVYVRVDSATASIK